MPSAGPSAATSGPSSTPPSRVHGALVLVQLAFASLAIAGKVAMGPLGVSPGALAMARILGGALVFVTASVWLRTPRVRSRGDALRLGALALVGIVLNQALFLAGLRDTSPIAATLLVATIPVFVALIAGASGRERLTPRTLAGIGLALLGVGVLTGFAVPKRGDLLVLLNGISYSVYIVFAKGVLGRYGATTVVAWIFGWGALLFAPFGGLALVTEAPGWSANATALVVFIVLVPTVLAYSVNAWALCRARPSLVSIYVYLQPLVVMALAWLLLDARVELAAVLGGALIFGGVGVVASARTRPPPP